MDKIAIETDVPPPTNKSRKDPLYPWRSMKPGDSFVVQGRASAAAARGSFRRYQKMGLVPQDWTVAQRTDDNYLSVRLWIVERQM